jgi:hypothetical protein
LGKTTDELYDEIENNAEESVKINTKTFDRLNRVLGKTDKKISDFGEGVSLSIEAEAALSEKIINATQVAGVAGGEQLKSQLDAIF